MTLPPHVLGMQNGDSMWSVPDFGHRYTQSFSIKSSMNADSTGFTGRGNISMRYSGVFVSSRVYSTSPCAESIATYNKNTVALSWDVPSVQQLHTALFVHSTFAVSKEVRSDQVNVSHPKECSNHLVNLTRSCTNSLNE